MKYTRKNEIKNFLLAKASTGIKPELFGVNIKTLNDNTQELVCTNGYRLHILSEQHTGLDDGIYYLDECKKIEGVYPDYEKIMPKEYDVENISLENLKNQIILAEKKEIGKVICVEIMGKFFNYKYVQDAIKFLESTYGDNLLKFEINYTSENKPIILKNNCAKAVIMPMNI